MHTLLAIAFASHASISLTAIGLAVGAAVGMSTTFGAKSGSGYLGTLPAGTNSQPFLPDNAPDGVIDYLLATVAVQLKSTAGVGPLVVGGLPMG